MTTGDRRIARACAVAMVVAIASLALPASGWAHAQLEGTSPGRDALVAAQPRLVTFAFSEAVTGGQGSVRVYDDGGNRADAGDATHPGDDPRRFGVGLQPGLPLGTYTATYRVVSADGHVVTGGFSFSVGKRTAASGENVGDLLAGQRTGAVTSTAFVAVRAAQYGAIAIGAGTLAFLLLVWLPALATIAGKPSELTPAAVAGTRRLRRLLLLAAGAGTLSALLGVGLEAAEAAGVSLWDAIDGTILGDVLDARFGTVWAGGAVLWMVVGIGATLTPRHVRPPTTRLAMMGVPLVGLLLLPALGGHSSVQDPVWLLLPANVLHVTAMAVWVGGLVALVAAVPATTRRLAPADRTRLLAAALARFSPLALGSVIVVLGTGIAQSLVEIDAWSQLLDTAFGRAVLVKLVLLVLLIGLGAINRQRNVPRLRALARSGDTPGAAGVDLRRTLRAEVLVVAVVIAVTGALGGYPPAKTASTGPVSVTTSFGPEQLQLTVDPAKPGRNELHVYLLDPKSGAQFDETKQITIEATQPDKGIGPLTLDAQKAGPGHYVVSSAILGAPGRWKVRVVSLVSDFDEYERTVDVRLR